MRFMDLKELETEILREHSKRRFGVTVHAFEIVVSFIVTLGVGIFSSGCDNISPLGVGELSKPRAYAGPDVVSKVGRYALLIGQGMAPEKGARLFYAWREDKNNPVKLDAYFYTQTLFVPFTKEGVYRYSLTAYNGTSWSNPDEVVIVVDPRTQTVFEDPVLEISVRRSLNAPEEELTDERLLDVDTLITEALHSLSGLEKCTRLISLELYGTGVSGCPEDLGPLSALSSLQKLAIENYTSLPDLSPIQGLHQVRSLWLSAGTIRDISPVSSLTQLEHLTLHSTDTLDISSLGTLTGLQSADFLFTPLTGISCLSHFSEIEELSMGYCGLKDIGPIQNCTQLTYLILAGNNIEDVTPLQSLHRSLTLRLEDNRITSVKPFADSRDMQIEFLDLYGNPLDSMSVNVYIPVLRGRGVRVYF